jgi:hypothetical protein
MSIETVLILAFVVVVMQALSYFSARLVLGKEVGWKVNNILGFGSAFTIWGSFYVGFFTDQIWLWGVTLAATITAVVYWLRKQSSYSISIKQSLLIYWGVIIRLMGVSIVVGVALKLVVFAVVNVAA